MSSSPQATKELLFRLHLLLHHHSFHHLFHYYLRLSMGMPFSPIMPIPIPSIIFGQSFIISIGPKTKE